MLVAALSLLLAQALPSPGATNCVPSRYAHQTSREPVPAFMPPPPNKDPVSVHVSVTVNADATVSGVAIQKGSGYPSFDRAVVHWARRQTYAPKKANCQPVKADADIWVFSSTPP
jgi:TonB family protein